MAQKIFTMVDVLQRKHVKDTVTVSHRWMDKTKSDPDGVQFKTIRKYLIDNPHIK